MPFFKLKVQETYFINIKTCNCLAAFVAHGIEDFPIPEAINVQFLKPTPLHRVDYCGEAHERLRAVQVHCHGLFRPIRKGDVIQLPRSIVLQAFTELDKGIVKIKWVSVTCIKCACLVIGPI